ncbi:MAG: glycoside hydrolase family 9 protein [Bacteroidales bacterium]|nr:glycoside hydrolase family 9 protein [Bacteroidales bacterium]
MKCWFPLVVLVAITGRITAEEPHYGDALQQSIWFYDCQRSGALPKDFRVPWRGDSCLHDGTDIHRNLAGGWFDAGDHIKSSISIGYAMTMLAWALIEYPDAYQKTEQTAPLLATLRHAAEYTLRCFLNDRHGEYEFVLQIGKTEGERNDHSVWVPAEVVHLVTDRPTYRVTTAVPGPDVAGQVTAAWAAASIAFRQAGDRAFADQLLTQARKLFRFADEYEGKPGRHVLADGTIAQGALYRDETDAMDKVAWAACWLHQAETAARTPGYTGHYLKKAQTLAESAAYQRQYLGKHWAEFGMFRVDKGVSLLLARLTHKARWAHEVSQFLDWWTIGVGDRVRYTPGGLAWRQDWGPLRFAVNTAWFALVWADTIADTDSERAARLRAFATRQIGYVLGDNPQKRSYLVGFGAHPWPVAHHRTAHGPWAGWEHFDKNSPVYLPRMRHTLSGAMLGGPDAEDRFTPDIQDFKQNEVALDYQAALPGCLARLAQDHPASRKRSELIPKVPSEPQLFVEAKIEEAKTGQLRLQCRVVNASTWPAFVAENVSFRYTGLLPAGKTPRDVTAQAGAGTRCTVAAGPRDGQFVVTVTFPQHRLFPGGKGPAPRYEPYYQVETPLTITIHAGWNPASDPSGSWITRSDAQEWHRRPALPASGD